MQKFQAQAPPQIMKLDERALRGFAESKAHAGELRVFVPHTSRQLTKACLNAVSTLTRNLGTRVTLLAVQIVPFPLSLDRPDVAPQFVERELIALARDRSAGGSRKESSKSFLAMPPVSAKPTRCSRLARNCAARAWTW
jgi:hypothetical protein